MMGLSQEKLGDKLGITFQQIQKYEKGTNRVGASRLQAMATALEVPISYFFPDARQDGAPAGMREDGSAFMMDFMSTSEGLELSRAFVRITQPEATAQDRGAGPRRRRGAKPRLLSRPSARQQPLTIGERVGQVSQPGCRAALAG